LIITNVIHLISGLNTNIFGFEPSGAVTENPAGQGVRAIPLCLPNNCQWNSETFQCVRTRAKRSSLYVVDEALEMLRKEKGIYLIVI